MNTNDKTLADAQPGGRVRLATVLYDRAHDLLADAYNAGTHGIGYSQQAMELHDAIIPAQPSPGGQGELLGYVRVEAIKALREDDEVTGVMVHVEERTDSVPVYLAARQPVGEPVEATDAMVEAALQSTVAHNASPWRQVVAAEDHADFISDMRAAINAALAALPYPLTVEATTTSTQTVPDHCDRIFWQHNYYQLPVGPADQKKPTKRRQAAVETVLSLGYLWRNDSWIAPTAQAVDLGAVRKCADEAVEFINHGYGGHARRKIQELLTLTDSQAVGK